MMSDGIKAAKARQIFDHNATGRIMPYSSKSVETTRHFLKKMSDTYSPIKKLENLIAAVSATAENDLNSSNQTRWSVGSKGPLRTDELLAKLMYVLVDHKMISAEIEADCIWGLVLPSFLTGERTYFLTMFSSAVALIKNLSKTSSPPIDNSLRISSGGLIKICVPDEKQDSTWTQILPFRPNMTSTDICQMMAYKLSLTNPHEYGLYLVKDGEEIRLNDTANLNDIKAGTHLLAYKRTNAKFIWPKHYHI